MTDRVMVDIETLGREPGCVVVSIGAVRFGSDGLGEEFFAEIAPASAQEFGLEIDAETLQWWLTQNGQARSQLVGGDDLDTALEAFAAWLPDDAEVWANSPSFDCEILDAAFAAVGQPTPWQWYNQRDVRTVKNFDAAPDIEQDGIEHNALDDAIYQARLVGETLGEIGELDDG